MGDAPLRSMLMPPVSRYMTTHPYAIGAREKLSSARHLMATRDIHHLPVMEEDRVIGIISDRDMFPIHPLHDIAVGETMAQDVAFVPPETPLDHVIDIMEAKRCGSVVVQGAKGVEGIFTVSDALRALSDILRRVENDP